MVIPLYIPEVYDFTTCLPSAKKKIFVKAAQEPPANGFAKRSIKTLIQRRRQVKNPSPQYQGISSIIMKNSGLNKTASLSVELVNFEIQTALIINR